jgi:UDP-N-acetylmuramyl pentapeptide phosphotransferase/UDP-N-acetylglucosamine-1-phosphate transferase
LFLIAATAGYAPLERRRRVMLGDTGANLLGAAAGLAALSLPPAAVAGVAAVLIAFHAWAERHSLSEWIDRHPLARRLDRLGGWDEPVPAE